MEKPAISALKIEPQHFEEFAAQLAKGLPFILTDGERRIELVLALTLLTAGAGGSVQ
jgi:hypothetical protein